MKMMGKCDITCITCMALIHNGQNLSAYRAMVTNAISMARSTNKTPNSTFPNRCASGDITNVEKRNPGTKIAAAIRFRFPSPHRRIGVDRKKECEKEVHSGHAFNPTKVSQSGQGMTNIPSA